MVCIRTRLQICDNSNFLFIFCNFFSGYVKLRKLEVLKSAVVKDADTSTSERKVSGDSVYSESGKESIESDDYPSADKGEDLVQKLGSKMVNSRNAKAYIKTKNTKLNSDAVENCGRRRSGPMRQFNAQVSKSNISNINSFKRTSTTFMEEINIDNIKTVENRDVSGDLDMKPRKSILKSHRRLSGTSKELKTKIKSNTYNTAAEDTETSGYRSTTSSKLSETESDYGYSTITESTTPRKVNLIASKSASTSGVLPDQCWCSLQIKAINYLSDDEDEETDDSASPLYETYHYLSSINFMEHFRNNFMDIGMGLGMTKEAIVNALTQGASIYCDTTKNGIKVGYEIFPAFKANWPNAADPWVIRERKIISNPSTNILYQWPTKNMVNKAIGLGCLLIPIGFRPKRGINPNQTMQWRITFPAAERYLESFLAHCHIRCYLFALTLHKAFMENRKAKMGIDASHFKNHLFWQCEDNYVRWPEDRLGEALRIFLKSFFAHFGNARFPNYFIKTCNDFKTIPTPELAKHRKQLHDILETPVMHLLYALDKIKYTKKEFYPAFNSKQLYKILTCKDPLHILNPNIPYPTVNPLERSDSEEDVRVLPDKNKDVPYIWKKKKQQRLIKQRRMNNMKQKSVKQLKEMNPMVSF